MTSESKSAVSRVQPKAPIKSLKRRAQIKKVVVVQNPSNAASGDALQIDIDIEEDTQKKAIQEREQVDIARKKNPYLFHVYDERCSLKFKSPQWLKQ